MTIHKFVEETGIQVSSTDYHKYKDEDLDMGTWFELLTSPYDCF